MKKYLYFLFFLASLSSKAQTSVYHPFPDSNASWGDAIGDFSWGYYSSCGLGMCYNSRETFSIIGKDTISGVAYIKMASCNIFYTNNCGSLYTTCIDGPKSSGLYVRQDTAAKKIWVGTGIYEMLLYDFNLNVGDSLTPAKIHWGSNLPCHFVESIDSVLIKGTYRKRFHLVHLPSCNYLKDTYLIEGIGCTCGLMGRPSTTETGFGLGYFIQDNQVLYGDTASMGYPEKLAWPSCLSTGIKDEKQSASISISPNPFTNEISIKYEVQSTKTEEVILFDVTGKEILHQKMSGAETKLNTEKVAAGFYLLRVGERNFKVVKGSDN